MRICPACGSQFPDDANFCPMDASRLPEPAIAPELIPAPVPGAAVPIEPAPSTAAAAPDPPAHTPPERTLSDQPAPIAGRFQPDGPLVATPTGHAGVAADLQGGAAVLLQVVDSRALPTATVADRALRELKQLAKVKSDRVLRVIDQGKTGNGQVYVACEAAPGPSLEELVRGGALSVERARAIVLDVGEALVEAQKVGVIHRDLSPRNVYVGERAKVTGFGVAEPIDERIFGSPAFLSPEQAEGKPVDQRSNIYSMGALLYYMVTGEAPFGGDSLAMVQQHLHAQPLPPSQRRPGLPSEVDKIVLKALEKSGGRRHLTLRQLLNEVDGLSAVASTPVPPPPGATLISGAPMPVVPATSISEAAPVSDGVPIVEAASQASLATTTEEMPVTPPPAEVPPPADMAPPAEDAALGEAPLHPAADAEAAEASSSARRDDGSNVKTILGMEIAMRPVAAAGSISEPVPLDRPVERNTRKELEATDPSLQPVGAPRGAPSASATAATLVEQQLPDEVRRAVAQLQRSPVEIAPVPQPAVPPIAQVPSSHSATTQPGKRPSGQVPTGRQSSGVTGGKGRKAFRETGWFKRGELEEELARKAAELSNSDPLAGPALTEAVVEESAITADDRARLSLKTGRTELMQAIKPGVLPGEQMSEEDMLAELEGGSRRGMVIGGAVIGVAALAAAIYFLILH